MGVCAVFAAILIAVFAAFKYFSSVSKRILEPYSEPSIFFPLKTLIFYLMIKLRKAKTHEKEKHENVGYGLPSHSDPKLMDCPQVLSSSIKAIDAIFFSGSSENGWGVVLAMERRPRRLCSALVYVKMPGKRVLVPLQHPDAVNFRAQEDEGIFRGGGLSFEIMEPIKAWRIRYDGELRCSHDKDGASYHVKIDFEWSSQLPIFNYDSDLDAWSMAEAFARETWSRKYFENLKEHHQTHYEQMGNLRGTISVNEEISSVALSAFRDHSFGKRRDWKLMHRYFFHHVFLSDGTKGVLGLVCQPSTCTRLVLGHWWSPSGECSVVTDIDLELREHGEGGTPPTEYAFTFRAGGQTHVVQVCFDVASIHYLGWDWEAKFHEVFVKYEVDGISGTGICEWEYVNRSGRPTEVTARDPQWSKLLRLEYLTS